jgi:sugar lactone lactonase YvrE
VEGSPLLDKDTTYYYKIVAVLDTSEEIESSSISAQVSEPVRGEEGDFWADIVLGKPDFTQIQMGKTTPYEPQHAAGILIDRTGEFDRMYIMDGGNHRILGSESIPTLASEPDLVLGQPDLYSSAANGDSAWQIYPYIVPASASSLCLAKRGLISMTEHWPHFTMALGENAGLFVTDAYNHRVLQYDNPFENDGIADGVWGQADFAANQENRGEGEPGNDGFHFGDYAAVDVDYLGNLWVADYGNHRVLRFSKDEGVIKPYAELVFGQPDFESGGAHSDSTGHTATYNPTGVRTVKQSNDDVWVYVSMLGHKDGGPSRIVVFKPPFEINMAGEVLRDEDICPLSIALDVDHDYLWMASNNNYVLRMKLGNGDDAGDIVNQIKVGAPGWKDPDGMDVDREGNLYVLTHQGNVYRYTPPDYDSVEPPDPKGPLGTHVYGIDNVVVSADSMYQCRGSAAAFGDQLVAADHAGRVLMWSYYPTLVDGQAADDLYGKSDFSSRTQDPTYAFPQTDTQGRLWLVSQLPAYRLR